MKKVTVIVLSLFMYLFSCSLMAYEEANLHQLDEQVTGFSNLVVEEDTLHFIEAIPADSEGFYTMVFDEAFMGDEHKIKSQWTYTFCYDYNTYCFNDMEIKKDLSSSLYYANMMSPDEKFYLTNIPASAQSGLNFVIYKGEFSHFKGFDYYKNTTTDEGVFLVDYDQMVNLEQLKNQLSANDNVDGDLTDSIEVLSDAFTTRASKLGEFLVKFGVKDKRHNQSFYDMYVKVVDLTSPVITGSDRIEIELNVDDSSIETLISQYVVSDNVDTLLTSNLVLSKDTYSSNKTSLGDYMIELSLTDLSNNVTKKQVSIKVKDTTKPEIKGPSVLFAYLSEQAKTVEEIKKLYKAVDLVDDESHLIVHYDLSNYTHQLGDHVITITAEDQSNNLSSKEVVIKVIDDVSPTFDVSNLVLKRTQVDQMTKEEIIAFLTRELKTRNKDITQVEILLNEAEYGSKHENQYIYFSFLLDGVTYQSKVMVEKEIDYIPGVVIALAAISLASISIYYIKKKWF